MDKILYQDNEWLKEKELVAGRVYVIKDGRIMLYLGRDLTGLYIFYTMASAFLAWPGNSKVTFGNYEAQLNGLVNIVNTSMNRAGIESCIWSYRGIPKIYGEFPFVNFEDKYKKWYSLSFSNLFDSNVNVPVLASISNKPIPKEFVSSNELIPGELYYGGQCWRNTYVYLGRNSKKEYLWYFVGSEEYLVQASAINLLYDCEKTKQNKRVKPIRMALKDSRAYVHSDLKALINSNFKVNMSGITKEMLDKV